jgi:hypothetical protein
MKDLRLLSLLGSSNMLKSAKMLFDFLICNIALFFFDRGDVILVGMGCTKLERN